MYISRIVIRNYRSFRHLDVSIRPGVTCIIGENNTGKTNLLKAIRLAVDTVLSSQHRTLSEQDIHASEDFSRPNQVVVSIEFRDYLSEVKEKALLSECQVEPGVARINYRFLPRRAVRDAFEQEEGEISGLSIESDYHFELTGGGEHDPSSVEWHQRLGSSLRFGDLQAFHVEYLPALRDVTQSMRQGAESPLRRILNSGEIGEVERDALVEIMKKANTEIESQPTIGETGEEIRLSFQSATGEAFAMNLKLGMADPSFGSIARSLKLLLSNEYLTDFEPTRNGLGLNNVLYISMLLRYFEQRSSSESAAGQLLLVEEPEAHLHPQLQRVLYTMLRDKGVQVFLTTHSTHISSLAPTESFIALTNNRDGKGTVGCVPKVAAGLSDGEAADLDRFLDATRSTLLYARKVMLVEGPAELFLIPVLIRQVLGIDLDRAGITVIPIYGKHFEVYAKLFSEDALNKKCAIVCDGDLDPNKDEIDVPEDSVLDEYFLDVDVTDLVDVYQCPVTFERAITLEGTVDMLIEAVRECGYPNRLADLEAWRNELRNPETTPDRKQEILPEMGQIVLNAAGDCGKARFSQIASKYVDKATALPTYIHEAVNWLMVE